jgi:Glycosyl hydrolase family 71
MLHRICATLLLLLLHGCPSPGSGQIAPLKYRAVGKSPEVLAVYEAWFGHPAHISVNYNSHDPAVIKNQIRHAQAMGISGFVVDWYGDREPFIDQSYALMQKSAAKNKFHIAMMYDESDEAVGATDEAIADFKMFHDAYLSPDSPGHEAYLTYEGRPVILIFPKGLHTDWSKVRASVSSWNPAPLLIYEAPAGADADAFDGFYPWFYIGSKGWAADGGNWGEESLASFYQTMRDKYPDKIILGGAWAQFNDSKASWGLNRQIGARCGQTYQDTFNFWRRVFPADEPIPFVLIETWNDYEEGSAVEPGLPTCNAPATTNSAKNSSPSSSATAQ